MQLVVYSNHSRDMSVPGALIEDGEGLGQVSPKKCFFLNNIIESHIATCCLGLVISFSVVVFVVIWTNNYWARIFKLLRSPRIDPRNQLRQPVRQPNSYSVPRPIDCLKITALYAHSPFTRTHRESHVKRHTAKKFRDLERIGCKGLFIHDKV